MAASHCIDASALFELKDSYPPKVFKSLWNEIEKLIEEEKLISPNEVLKEINAGNDALVPWAKKYKRMFLQIDKEQEDALKKILAKFPDFADELKSKPVFADPWVVALAMAQGVTVVMMEHRAQAGQRPKIPDVCEAFRIKCITLLEWFEEQTWEF